MCEGPKDAKDGQPAATYDIIEIINNPTTRALRLTIQGEEAVTSLAYSKDGERLARGEGNNVVVCCAASGLEQCQLRGEKQINSVAFSPDGSLIAAGDGHLFDEGTIWLYNAATGDPFGSPLSGHSNGVNSVCWNNDGTKLASGSSDDTVKVWDPTTGECLWTLRCDSGVLSVSWSPDGAKIAAGLGYPSPSVVVFDSQTGDQLCQLRGHRYVLFPNFSGLKPITAH